MFNLDWDVRIFGFRNQWGWFYRELFFSSRYNHTIARFYYSISLPMFQNLLPLIFYTTSNTIGQLMPVRDSTIFYFALIDSISKFSMWATEERFPKLNFPFILFFFLTKKDEKTNHWKLGRFERFCMSLSISFYVYFVDVFWRSIQKNK